jgi:hypothetical protein
MESLHSLTGVGLPRKVAREWFEHFRWTNVRSQIAYEPMKYSVGRRLVNILD